MGVFVVCWEGCLCFLQIAAPLTCQLAMTVTICFRSHKLLALSTTTVPVPLLRYMLFKFTTFVDFDEWALSLEGTVDVNNNVSVYISAYYQVGLL